MIIPTGSRGAALILAMLIVAMVTAISVELTWRFDLGATRSGNRWYGMQANSYLEGAEEVAKYFLMQDLQQGQETDSLDEEWASMPMQFDTDEGYIAGTLQDAAGLFNINSMTPEPQQTPQARSGNSNRPRFTASQEQFVRLLQTIPLEQDVFLDPQRAENITEAVMDWLDADSDVTGFGGGESDYYGRLDIPYTIANKQMVSVSELRIIKGLNELPQSFFEGLYPLVIALPKDVKLNINTAPEQILRSLNQKGQLNPLSVNLGQNLLAERGLSQSGFKTVAEFVDAVAPLLNLSANNIATQFDQSNLDVKSSYFILSSETQVGDRLRRSRTMLHRVSDSQVDTLRRTNANF